MRKELLNKKGQVDILTIGLVLFVIAFVGLLFFKIIGGVNTQVQNATMLANESKTASANYYNNTASGWDQGIMIALGFSFILTLVFAFQINTNPGYFFIFLFILIIILAVATILPQLFDMGTNSVNFATERALMPMSTWVGSNVFLVAIAMAAFILIALFAKISRGSG